MTPQQQRDPSPSGDCLAACIASLLNEKIETVPNFTAIQGPPTDGWEAWYFALQSFLAVRGLAFMEFTLTKDTPFYGLPHETLCILAGTTTFGVRHAVVGKVVGQKFVEIFNPHPSGLSIEQVESVCFLVPLDPALIHRDPVTDPGAGLTTMTFAKNTNWIAFHPTAEDPEMEQQEFRNEEEARDAIAINPGWALKVVRNLQSVEILQVDPLPEKPH